MISYSPPPRFSCFIGNFSRNIPADADRARADLSDVDGQPVECAHARLVDDLRRRAVLPEGLKISFRLEKPPDDECHRVAQYENNSFRS